MAGGWAGLAGAHRGYMDRMAVKEDRDWKSQQASIQNQRAMNLENLRAANVERGRVAEFGRKEEALGEARTFQKGLLTEERVYQKGIREEEALAAPSEMFDEETGKPLSEAEYAEYQKSGKKAISVGELTLAQAEEAHKLTKKLDQEGRTEKANAYEAAMSTGPDDPLTPTELLTKFSIDSGISLKTLVTTKSGKTPTGSQMEKIDTMLSNDPAYNDWSTQQRINKTMDAWRQLNGEAPGGASFDTPEGMEKFARALAKGDREAKARLNELQGADKMAVQALVEAYKKEEPGALASLWSWLKEDGGKEEVSTRVTGFGRGQRQVVEARERRLAKEGRPIPEPPEPKYTKPGMLTMGY